MNIYKTNFFVNLEVCLSYAIFIFLLLFFTGPHKNVGEKLHIFPSYYICDLSTIVSYSTIILYTRDHVWPVTEYPPKPASILPFDNMGVLVGKAKPKQVFKMTQNAFNK